MYKDPTEFRARFKAYKEGKMPYENGLPKFAGGKIDTSNESDVKIDMGPKKLLSEDEVILAGLRTMHEQPLSGNDPVMLKLVDIYAGGKLLKLAKTAFVDKLIKDYKRSYKEARLAGHGKSTAKFIAEDEIDNPALNILNGEFKILDLFKNGKLPKYAGGTTGEETSEPITYSDDDAFAYIAALENPGKVGWDGKVWRVPKGEGYDHNALAYGLDIREEHNPDVYNYLKSKGRLGNPYLTDKEARTLAMKSYKSKDAAINKAIQIAKGNISLRGYEVLRGMAWHGHPMKMLLDADSVTGKAFRKAIANGDRDLNGVFDAYYLHPGNATKYAARIKADASFRNVDNKRSFGRLKVDKGDGRTTYIDWGEPLPPWNPEPIPKIHNQEYPLDSNVPESISSWSGADSPSKGIYYPDIIQNVLQQLKILDQFKWKPITSNRKSILPPLSKLMPSLDLMMEDQLTEYVKDIIGIENPFNDVLFHAKNGKIPSYSNGKISIKPSKRGSFTAAAKAHGASVAEFERRVLKNPEKYSKAMRKKAQFSHNARSWKH